MTNPSTIAPQRLERLRRICLALPEATEKEAWGDPTWRVGDRIFAVQKGNFEGRRPSVWLKGPEGAQEASVGSDGDRFFVPPYVGGKGWVGVHLDGPLDWEELSDLVEESYRLIAPKRLVRALQGPAAPGSPGASGPTGV